MIVLAALSAGYAGFAWLALTMDRHQRQVWGHPVSGRARYLLRVGGSLGLALSLLACVLVSGWPVGAVLWAGVLTVTALAVVFVLTYRPRLVAWSAPLAWLLAVIVVVW